MNEIDVQQLRIRDLRRVLYDDPEADDLLALDSEAEPDNYKYNTYATRFIAGMREKGIQVTGGIYEDRVSVLSFSCDACSHTWETMAKNAQVRGCPVCRVFHANLKKAKKLWDRSKNIIRDKGGKIVKFPQIAPEKKPSVDDKFLLVCRRGHRFRSSHRKLYRNAWCPICKAKKGDDGIMSKETSQFIYKKRMTNPEKYVRLRDIAEIKGSRIINATFQANAYTLLCTACGKETQGTAKQICDNRYLCSEHCIQGNRFTLHERER